MIRVALISQEDRPWLCEVKVVLLSYPIELDEVDEGGNTIGTRTVSTDEEFGTWCEELSYWYEIIEEFSTK